MDIPLSTSYLPYEYTLIVSKAYSYFPPCYRYSPPGHQVLLPKAFQVDLAEDSLTSKGAGRSLAQVVTDLDSRDHISDPGRLGQDSLHLGKQKHILL